MYYNVYSGHMAGANYFAGLRAQINRGYNPDMQNIANWLGGGQGGPHVGGFGGRYAGYNYPSFGHYYCPPRPYPAYFCGSVSFGNGAGVSWGFGPGAMCYCGYNPFGYNNGGYGGRSYDPDFYAKRTGGGGDGSSGSKTEGSGGTSGSSSASSAGDVDDVEESSAAEPKKTTAERPKVKALLDFASANKAKLKRIGIADIKVDNGEIVIVPEGDVSTSPKQRAYMRRVHSAFKKKSNAPIIDELLTLIKAVPSDISIKSGPFGRVIPNHPSLTKPNLEDALQGTLVRLESSAQLDANAPTVVDQFVARYNGDGSAIDKPQISLKMIGKTRRFVLMYKKGVTVPTSAQVETLPIFQDIKALIGNSKNRTEIVIAGTVFSYKKRSDFTKQAFKSAIEKAVARGMGTPDSVTAVEGSVVSALIQQNKHLFDSGLLKPEDFTALVAYDGVDGAAEMNELIAKAETEYVDALGEHWETITRGQTLSDDTVPAFAQYLKPSFTLATAKADLVRILQKRTETA